MSPPNHMFLSPFMGAFGVVAGESLRLNMAGPVAAALLPAAAASLASSAASSLLFFRACSRSTRSLHCNSMLRNESCNALSVSVLGV